MSRVTITERQFDILMGMLDMFHANADESDYACLPMGADAAVVDKDEVGELRALLFNSAKLSAICIEQDTADMPVPKVVIEVSGGVAECTDDGGCEVLIVDHDNLEEDLALHCDDLGKRLKEVVQLTGMESMTMEEMLEAGKQHFGADDKDVRQLAEALSLFDEYGDR